MTILVLKNLPLIFRPHTPIFYGILVGGTITLAQEVDANGIRRRGAGTRGGIGSREDRGGELDEKEKEGGRESLHCPRTEEWRRSMCILLWSFVSSRQAALRCLRF